MNVTFNNAPLVEIVAELRWSPVSDFVVGQQSNGIMPASIFSSNALEEFFMRFGGACYQHGFQRAERLIPSGFPAILGQPVFRYKKGSETSPELYQVGLGLFSANAIPPYKSWSEFSPIVEKGIHALLVARNESEKDAAFSKVSLRYIDAFGPSLTKGMPLEDFVSEVLGFKVHLPLPVSSLVAKDQKAKVLLQLNFPTENAMIVNITVGEGQANNASVVVLDTTVSSQAAISPDAESVMHALNTARTIIHDMFLKLTNSFSNDMKPTEGA